MNLRHEKPRAIDTPLITKDFHGLPIVFREDGYINMTKAVKHFPGKRLNNFWANSATDEYMVALHMVLSGNSWDSSTFDHEDAPRLAANYLVEFRRGRNGGTFCHPKMAVFFARWLDVRFAVWCDLIHTAMHTMQ